MSRDLAVTMTEVKILYGHFPWLVKKRSRFSREMTNSVVKGPFP
jgi:hypothetical protein